MNSGQVQFYFQQHLRDELVRRIDRNPRYSLRSFAVALGLNSSDLSQILAGKRSISTKVADRIMNALELSIDEQKRFLESILEQKKEKGLLRLSPRLSARLKQVKASRGSGAVRGVGLDEFRVISDWYHYAIRELTESKHFKPDPKWIARVLQLTVMESKLALERLLNLELIEFKNGTYVKTSLQIDTKDKSKTSLFLRKRQMQVLEKSILSLEKDPLEERSHNAVTLCIDPELIPEAKAKIQKLMWELSEFLVSGNQERVYEMQFSLFPLQEKEQGVKK